MLISSLAKWRIAAALVIVLVSGVTATGVYYATRSSTTTDSVDAKGSPSAVSENSSNTGNPSDASNPSGSATIYATVGMHVENTGGKNNPDYVTDEVRFWEDRNLLLEFATMLKEEKVAFDFMSDVTFLEAVIKYDKDQSNTGGKNIIQYLSEDLGVSIDPHAHETSTANYADVAYLVDQLGVTPSGVVGGFLVEDGTSRFLVPMQAKSHDYAWTPTILWGGGTGNHINESSYWTSGIWRPSSSSFATDDPSSPLPDIGNYKSDWTGLDDLLAKRKAGTLEAQNIYTITIMTNLRDINQPGYIDSFKKELDARQSATDSGEIKWLTLPEVINVWRVDYDSHPSRLIYDGVSTSKGVSGTGSGKGSLGSGSSQTNGSCGDAICQPLEQKMNVCPEDCP